MECCSWLQLRFWETRLVSPLLVERGVHFSRISVRRGHLPPSDAAGDDKSGPADVVVGEAMVLRSCRGPAHCRAAHLGMEQGPFKPESARGGSRSLRSQPVLAADSFAFAREANGPNSSRSRC